jgi:hypothetical protein
VCVHREGRNLIKQKVSQLAGLKMDNQPCGNFNGIESPREITCPYIQVNDGENCSADELAKRAFPIQVKPVEQVFRVLDNEDYTVIKKEKVLELKYRGGKIKNLQFIKLPLQKKWIGQLSKQGSIRSTVANELLRKQTEKDGVLNIFLEYNNQELRYAISFQLEKDGKPVPCDQETRESFLTDNI